MDLCQPGLHGYNQGSATAREEEEDGCETGRSCRQGFGSALPEELPLPLWLQDLKLSWDVQIHSSFAG